MDGLSIRRRIALDIARSMRKSQEEEHPLRQLFWECTLRCNLRCQHCGSDCKQVAATPDMPKEDFFKVLDSIAAKTDPHKVFVIVSGGEPTMRADLEECGKGIYSRGFPWGMVTNGFGMTEERFSRLLGVGLHSMTVSLDGLEENHDWLRGREGSFTRAAETIRMAVRSGIAFDVVTCVNRRNYPQLSQLKEFLIGIGLKEWRLFSIFPQGRAALNPDLQLPPEMFRGMLDFIKETRKEGRIKASYGCEGFLGPYEGDVRDHFYSCQAGVTVGSVLVDGSISACTSIRSDYHQGNNIYKDDFMDVWEHRFQPYRDRSWMRKDDCADCKYWKWCEGNGMHLRDSDGKLMLCHLKRILDK